MEIIHYFHLTPYMTPEYNDDRGEEMSKWDKLIKKIISLSKDIRFSELKKVVLEEMDDYDVK